METRMVLIIVILTVALMLTQIAYADLADEDVPEAIDIIQRINEYRKSKGLWPYTYNPLLALAAQGHAEYQAAIKSEGTHKGIVGLENSTDRARAQGYNGDVSVFRTDEMIYNGMNAKPTSAVGFWKGSSTHEPIMSSSIYHEIGVGIAYTEDGRKYIVANLGMIPGETSKGSPEYSAPSVEEYKSWASIPIVTVTPQANGMIIHLFKQGETLDAIAVAYEISLDELLSLNSAITAGEPPSDGVTLLIRQPDIVTLPTLTPTKPTSIPRPTDTLVPAPFGSIPGEGSSPEFQGGVPFYEGENGVGAIVPQGENLSWLWGLLMVVALGAGGLTVFWYLPRLRTTVQEEGFDLETWLNEDLQEKRENLDGSDDEELQSTTEEFDHLERPQQIRLLEQAARRALAAYPLQVESVELLRYMLNAEFVVQARPDNGADALKRYVLRVNAPGFHTRAEIASELIWLDALTRDTKLIVPVPVRTRKGGWVETVDHPALGIFRHCVLFEYLPASSAETAITPQRMEFLGALIALLHRHGAGFKPPAGFIRKHWDLEGMRGEMLDVPATQALAALEDDERRVLNEAEELVAEAMNELGTGPEVYGLIHGDLHLKSLLFTADNRPVVIDFDTCGWGYYVYDLAVAVWNIFNRDDFTTLRDALLRGYRKVRPLSRMEETLMIHFVAGRLMVQILTWAPRRAHSPLRETADKAIDRQVSQLKALLQTMNE